MGTNLLRMMLLASAGLSGAICLSPAAAHAQEQSYEIRIPAQPLGDALRSLGRATRQTIVFDGAIVRGKRSAAVHGRMSPSEALDRMLANSGLVRSIGANGVLMVRSRTAPGNGADAASGETRAETGAPQDGSSEIVVTGTNIRGKAPVGNQLLTIRRSEIDQTGYATTPQLIQSLSQNSALGANEGNFSRSTVQNANFNGTGGTAANLRGLGPLSTLVLVNGRRITPSGLGTFGDVGIIPLSAVERVEVVLDGASAIYGSDAIGGVINFSLRRDFDGGETNLRFGAADGFTQVQASQLLGKTWSTGSALISYEFERRGGLNANERDYFTQDLRAFGGSDFRTPFSNPGTITAGGLVYGIPANQDGSSLEPGDLIAGQRNLADQNQGTSILPKRIQHSVMGVVTQEAAPWLKLFVEGFYTWRKVEQSIAAASATLNVPATNPFFISPVANAQSVQVQYSFLKDFGATSYANDVQNYNLTLGAETAFGGGWNLRAHGSYGADNQTTRLGNVLNSARLALALADSNSDTAFNPFGDGTHSNPATVEAIKGYNRGRGKYELTSINAVADGPLFDLPGGSVRVAVGGEWREERFSTRSEALQSSLTPRISSYRLGRDVLAAFAEIRVPLVGASNRRPGLHSLEFSLAGRNEDYSDFGAKATPKIGLTWEPSRDLSFRANWGKSFQAPSLRELSDLNAAYIIAPLPDPKSPTGSTLTLLYSASGNSALGPQTAKTWSVGTDIHPTRVPGFTLNISYFDVDYDNLVGSIGSNIPSALVLDKLYAPLVIRSPNAAFVESAYATGLLLGAPVDPALIGAFVNAAPINLGSLKQSGLDVAARHSIETDAGRFGLQANFTWILKYDVAQTASAPFVDMLDTINNPIDLRARGGLTWTRGDVNAAVFVNYVDGYRNNGVVPEQKVASWTTFDAQATWAVRPDIILSVQAQNIFDAAPPFVNSQSYGYDPAAANAIGRFVSASIRKKW